MNGNEFFVLLMPIANEIIRFFDQQYLQKELLDYLSFWQGDKTSNGERNETYFYFLSGFSFMNIHKLQDCRGRGRAFL